jgi:Fe-S-cluster containining protein
MKDLTASEGGGLPYAMRDKRILAKNESFRFGCHPGVACYTRCCGDVNILLTPLDVVHLSRRLGITTTEFLAKHTVSPITKELQLPVIVLKMNEDAEKHCPFLAEQGCGVYEDRPWACRMYPLGMGLPPAKAGVEPEPVYFLFEDDFCQGREEATEWTVAGWLSDQGISKRDEIDAGFHEVVSHPWFIGGTRQLDPKRMEMFHTAFYDLDRFRLFVFESSFLERFEVEDDLVEKMRTDDEALLRFASRWLRFALFAEPTMKVRASAQPKQSTQPKSE